MWATFDIADARDQISMAIGQRFAENPPPQGAQVLQFPVGLFFMRGDRGGLGQELAEQVLRSYGYWNDEAGKYLDVVFFGWGKDGDSIVYDSHWFSRCKEQLESTTKWRYSGETDLLLVNFEVRTSNGELIDGGNFSFKRTIPLRIEEMIREGKVGSLDGFMQELIGHARRLWEEEGAADVWKLSGEIAYFRGRKSLWAACRDWLLRDFNQVYEDLRPFAVCDLRG